MVKCCILILGGKKIEIGLLGHPHRMPREACGGPRVLDPFLDPTREANILIFYYFNFFNSIKYYLNN